MKTKREIAAAPPGYGLAYTETSRNLAMTHGKKISPCGRKDKVKDEILNRVQDDGRKNR